MPSHDATTPRMRLIPSWYIAGCLTTDERQSHCDRVRFGCRRSLPHLAAQRPCCKKQRINPKDNTATHSSILTGTCHRCLIFCGHHCRHSVRLASANPASFLPAWLGAMLCSVRRGSKSRGSVARPNSRGQQHRLAVHPYNTMQVSRPPCHWDETDSSKVKRKSGLRDGCQRQLSTTRATRPADAACASVRPVSYIFRPESNRLYRGSFHLYPPSALQAISSLGEPHLGHHDPTDKSAKTTKAKTLLICLAVFLAQTHSKSCRNLGQGLCCQSANVAP